MEADPTLHAVIKPGDNCWAIASATRASVIIDAADYYHYAREVMEEAQQRILVIGWDFDTRISLEPEDADGETLGAFFLRLAKANPSRKIDILKWSFGALKQFLRPGAVLMLWRWWRTKAIDFRFDSAHPAGCSHHQKIVVIDDTLAVVGGIDMSKARWDTRNHDDGDPRRTLPGGALYPPWHDVTMMMSGPIAEQVGELSRERWHRATGAGLDPCENCPDHWPDDLPVMFENATIAIARTRAAYQDADEIREVEALWLDMIAACKHYLYIENQYLTSGKIAAAIAHRMEEDDPPEIIVVMPRSADGWLESRAMDAARVQLARAIAKADHKRRFRIYVPVTAGGEDIYVHAKLAVMDGRLLRVGSANLNNRSFGLDSECDVVIDCALPGNEGFGPAIEALRDDLLAEHLGLAVADFTAAMADHGSLIGAIDALRQPAGQGRSLDLLDLEKPGAIDQFIADNELLDPEHPEGFFEPLHKRSLWRRWREGKTMMRWRQRRFERRKARFERKAARQKARQSQGQQP